MVLGETRENAANLDSVNGSAISSAGALRAIALIHQRPLVDEYDSGISDL